MPNYDLRSFIDVRSGDGQLYHSDNVTPDEFYNCVWEGVRIAARDLGAGEAYDDEQLRHLADQFRPATQYGERFDTAAQVVGVAYPQLKAWTEQPTDIVVALTDHIAKGDVVEIGFYCDTNATVPPVGPITYSHNEILLALDTDHQVATFGNVEPHPTYQLTFDQVRQLWDQGGILVVTKGDASDMTDSERDDLSRALGRLVYEVSRHDEPESEAALQNFVNLAASKGFSDAVASYLDTQPEFQDDARRQRELEVDADQLDKLVKNPPHDGAPGLKGDPGPQGPVGPAGVAGKDAVLPTVIATSPAVDASWGALLAELLRRVLGRS